MYNHTMNEFKTIIYIVIIDFFKKKKKFKNF